MENLGTEKAIIKTVFAYKVNVAIAAIMSFTSAQTFISILATTDDVAPIVASLLFFASSITYGLLSLNGYLTKITVHESGFVIKSPLRKTIVCEGEIKKATFRRVNLRKMMIDVALHDGRNISINSAKYDDATPLIKYLTKFK